MSTPNIGMRLFRMSYLIAVAVVVALGQLVQAQEATNGSGALSLKEAISRTLSRNGELQSYPFNIRALDGEMVQAGQKPLPVIAGSLENVIGTGDLSGIKAAEFTVTLSQAIEMGGKRGARRGLIGARQRLLEQEYLLARNDMLAETTRRYYYLLHLQSLTVINARRLEARRTARELVETRTKAGVIPGADLARLDMEITRIRARRAELTAAGKAAAIRLAAMWQGEPDFEAVSGSLGTAWHIPASETLQTMLAASPDYMKAVALERIGEAGVSLAAAQRTQNLTIGAGLRRNETLNDQALVLSFSMPLAFGNPNKGRIDAARERYQGSLHERDRIRRSLELSLLELRQSMAASKAAARRIDVDLMPAARRLLDEGEKAWETGAWTLMEWLNAGNTVFALDEEKAALEMEFMMNLLELERITGNALATAEAGEKR